MKRFGIAVLGLALLGLPGASLAKANSQAEADRLYGEMKMGAQKNQWSKVERFYRQISKLKKVKVPAGAYVFGAQAARTTGDVQAIFDRLRRAQKAGSTDSAVAPWLADLKAHYGKVRIAKQKKANRALSAVSSPFAPDQRAAISFAAAKVKSKGKFAGWLPAMAYKLGSKSFKVKAGTTTKVKKR